MDVIPHRKHDPLCDEAWVWDAFMDGREINGAECWMCGLLSKADARARQDEARRNAAPKGRDVPKCSLETSQSVGPQ